MNEKIKTYDSKMTKTINNLDGELATIRAGRANPHVLDKLTVDYYGAPTPIQQVANVSVPEARMIQIQPWEKSLLKGIEKAIPAQFRSDQAMGSMHAQAATKTMPSNTELPRVKRKALTPKRQLPQRSSSTKLGR